MPTTPKTDIAPEFMAQRENSQSVLHNAMTYSYIRWVIDPWVRMKLPGESGNEKVVPAYIRATTR